MQFSKNPGRPRGRNGARPTRQFWRLNWARVLVCLIAIAALTGAAQSGQQGAPEANRDSTLNSVPAAQPDANAQMQGQNAKQQSVESPDAERKKQIADDSAKLLKLATDLKAEVDKTTKDTLSITVIRKADEIEKLAHTVKEKTKFTAGSS